MHVDNGGRGFRGRGCRRRLSRRPNPSYRGQVGGMAVDLVSKIACVTVLFVRIGYAPWTTTNIRHLRAHDRWLQPVWRNFEMGEVLVGRLLKNRYDLMELLYLLLVKRPALILHEATEHRDAQIPFLRVRHHSR